MTGKRRVLSYEEQLSLLSETYREALKEDIEPLRAMLSQAANRPALYVGSGGALPVAHLAAALHTQNAGTMATAASPLQLSSLPTFLHASVVIFSARATNPDTRLALDAAVRRQLRPTAIVTGRSPQDLPPYLLNRGLEIVTLKAAGELDGFLATNSVLAMAIALIRASTNTRLPAHLRGLPTAPAQLIRPAVCILHSPGLLSAALDLETRLSELGLACVQLTDYRNFAHGRHLGLWRRRHETTVIAMIEPAQKALAEATLRLLPSEVEVARIETSSKWPLGVVELLAASMRLAGSIAAVQRVNPARPRVQPFGRRLYHLNAQRLLGSQVDPGPVHRKLAAVGALASSATADWYQAQLFDWLARIRTARFRAMVLDYDGTVNDTSARFELPPLDVREELMRLLNAGLIIGFASGRGGSLPESLRQWIPQRFWYQVRLALYNGGLLLRLADDLPARRRADDQLRSLRERLQGHPLFKRARMEFRPWQARVNAGVSSPSPPEQLAIHLQELVERDPPLALKVISSGHSIDVVPRTSSKARVAAELREEMGSDVLCIGDQGQLGGNDFELLAWSYSTLSVDRCSSDPSRCWNLTRSPSHGPVSLVEYLARMRIRDQAVLLDWPRQ